MNNKKDIINDLTSFIQTLKSLVDNFNEREYSDLIDSIEIFVNKNFKNNPEYHYLISDRLNLKQNKRSSEKVIEILKLISDSITNNRLSENIHKNILPELIELIRRIEDFENGRETSRNRYRILENDIKEYLEKNLFKPDYYKDFQRISTGEVCPITVGTIRYKRLLLIILIGLLEEGENLIRIKMVENNSKIESKMQSMKYIKQEIINGFKNKKDIFNYKKLICLLNELNSNFESKHVYSSLALIRAVLDHIPPILGCSSFEEVVNNYPWQRTDKKYMETLSKDASDDALHRQISKKEDLLDMVSIPNSIAINRLLQECLESKEGKNRFSLVPKTIKNSESNRIKIKIESKEIRWANFLLARGTWSSFLINLEIDNFDNNKPDYVSISIKAKLDSGEEWIGNHFIYKYKNTMNIQGNQDEKLRIGPKQVESINFYVSNYVVSAGRIEEMPKISNKPIEILVSTRSGEEIITKIPREKIVGR